MAVTIYVKGLSHSSQLRNYLGVIYTEVCLAKTERKKENIATAEPTRT
jgi:hypothetical protein